MNRVQLAKEAWRVVVRDTPEARLRAYQKGTETYFNKQHAKNHADKMRKRGFEVKAFKSKLKWEEVEL